jgi:hypothetical protein
VEEGFSLMDSDGKGMIDFDTFCDWWSNLKVNDALGLRQQWKRRLYEDESKMVKLTSLGFRKTASSNTSN